MAEKWSVALFSVVSDDLIHRGDIEMDIAEIMGMFIILVLIIKTTLLGSQMARLEDRIAQLENLGMVP